MGKDLHVLCWWRCVCMCTYSWKTSSVLRVEYHLKPSICQQLIKVFLRHTVFGSEDSLPHWQHGPMDGSVTFLVRWSTTLIQTEVYKQLK